MAEAWNWQKIYQLFKWKVGGGVDGTLKTAELVFWASITDWLVLLIDVTLVDEDNTGTLDDKDNFDDVADADNTIFLFRHMMIFVT